MEFVHFSFLQNTTITEKCDLMSLSIHFPVRRKSFLIKCLHDFIHFLQHVRVLSGKQGLNLTEPLCPPRQTLELNQIIKCLLGIYDEK